MSTSFDQADELAAKQLPVESSSRRLVFLPGCPYHTREMLLSWVQWAGETEFVWDAARAMECGICIFHFDSLGLGNWRAELVTPFFVRHGAEANVFEFDPVEKNFRRLSEYRFGLQYPTG